MEEEGETSRYFSPTVQLWLKGLKHLGCPNFYEPGKFAAVDWPP